MPTPPPLEWSNDKLIKFLELYEIEKVIWDPRDKNHKLKHKVRDAWNRISTNLDNTPIEELKLKKKSLMATFRPLLKKKKATIRSGASADDVFQPVWFAFEIMERFLGTLYYGDEAEHITSHNTLKPNVKEEKLTSTPYPKSKNIIKRPIRSQHLNNCSTDSIPYKDNTHNYREWDECDLYGQLLAKKMRKLDEHQRDMAMHEIDNTMFRAMMKSRASKLRYSSESGRKSSPVFITIEENPIEYEEAIRNEELDDTVLD